MSSTIKRGEIYWISLDPTVGSEINKTRPALIVSNDAGNKVSPRVIVAPITSQVKNVFRFEVKIEIKGKSCKVLLDQIKSVDKIRIGAKIMSLDNDSMEQVDSALKIALSLT